MRGLAVRQGNKDSAGLVFTNKVSIENKEFRDPLLVLGRGNVIAATLPTTKPKNLPFTPKKNKVRGGRTLFGKLLSLQEP